MLRGGPAIVTVGRHGGEQVPVVASAEQFSCPGLAAYGMTRLHVRDAAFSDRLLRRPVVTCCAGGEQDCDQYTGEECGP